MLATLSLDKHLTYVALTRHREDVALYYGRRSFQKAGALIPILSQRRAKETTLDYERGSLYRDALRFAANRGLHIVRVARTLMSDRLRWTVRQKQRLTEVGRRLRALGAKLGLVDGRKPIINTAHKEAKPMVTGVTTFPKISHRHRRGQNPGGPRHQEAVGGCLHPLPPRLCRSPAGVQGDELRRHAEGSGRCEHDARVHRRNPGIIRRAAWKKRPDGRQGGQGGTPARRRQCAGAPARHRALLTSSRRGRAQARVAIDIPALSRDARRVLERVRDAIERNDLPSALEFALEDRMVEADIDGFSKAVAERFGDRTFLPNAAKEPNGQIFEKAAADMDPARREQLKEAWPAMRAAQQLAAGERTAQALKQAEAQRLIQSQGQTLK